METSEKLNLINKIANLKKDLRTIDDKIVRIVDQRKHIYKKVKKLTKTLAKLENEKTN